MGLIRGRVQHDEWTKFENGVAVCGVGYRGFWTNNATFGGPSPWYECKCGQDCTGWALRETGKHIEVKRMTLREMIDATRAKAEDSK